MSNVDQNPQFASHQNQQQQQQQQQHHLNQQQQMQHHLDQPVKTDSLATNDLNNANSNNNNNVLNNNIDRLNNTPLSVSNSNNATAIINSTSSTLTGTTTTTTLTSTTGNHNNIHHVNSEVTTSSGANSFAKANATTKTASNPASITTTTSGITSSFSGSTPPVPPPPPPPNLATSTTTYSSTNLSETTMKNTVSNNNTTSTTLIANTATNAAQGSNTNNKGNKSKNKDNNNNSNNNNISRLNENNDNNNINISPEGKSLMNQQPLAPTTTFASANQPVAPLPSAPAPTPAEPKPKTSRPRKNAAAASNNKGANQPVPKPETKRSRGKAAKAVAAPVATENSQPVAAPSSVANDRTQRKVTQPQNIAMPPTKKRKSRSSSNESSNTANPPTTTAATAPSTTAKRPRRKKSDQTVSKPPDNSNVINGNALMNTTPANIPLSVTNPQLLSVAPHAPMDLSPSINIAPQPHHLQSPHVNTRLMPGMSPIDSHHDASNRYFSLTISPYANYDYSNAASLTRPSLSRLFTTSSSAETNSVRGNTNTDELAKAFEELRDGTWTNLSRCILEQAQQFDVPSLLGTLYALREENNKLVSRVRELNTKRDQLLAINARLELPGQSLLSHLNATSPNFSSIVSGLTNSPKSLPNTSPRPATKSPFSGPTYNHVPPSGGPLGPPSFLDRSSPLVSVQTAPHLHPPAATGVGSLKSSSLSSCRY